MTRKPKIQNITWSVGRGYGRIYLDPEYGSLSGVVYTRHGIVKVYSQGGNGFVQSTSIEFVFNGVCHVKRIKKRYSTQFLVTLAKRFTEDVVKGDINE